MDCKEKMFLIVYVGTKRIDIVDTYEYMRHVVKSLDIFDETVSVVAVPDPTAENIVVDCINPKLLTGEEYKEVEKKIDTLNERVRELELESHKKTRA